MAITEGSVYVTGTMAFWVSSANNVSVTYQSSTGGRGTINLARVGAGPPAPQPQPPSPPRTPPSSTPVDLSNI
jgi:hypothetical protein